MKKVWSVITTVIVAAVVVAAVLLVGVRIFGYTPFAILSPSMTPTYAPGDLVYVKAVPFEELKPGDVVTFAISEDKTVTHRIVEIDAEEQCVYTKGDANDTRDGAPAYYVNIVGTVRFSIPKLGYVSSFLSTSRGKYIGIMAICILILILVLPELFKAFAASDRKGKAVTVSDTEAAEASTENASFDNTAESPNGPSSNSTNGDR